MTPVVADADAVDVAALQSMLGVVRKWSENWRQQGLASPAWPALPVVAAAQPPCRAGFGLRDRRPQSAALH